MRRSKKIHFQDRSTRNKPQQEMKVDIPSQRFPRIWLIFVSFMQHCAGPCKEAIIV